MKTKINHMENILKMYENLADRGHESKNKKL